ncbi:hypothetical protein KVT40_007178 [Elsinoe batatas]|uniref:Palmitoyltransferase n=1 Tax=Elsinoe batatas TaxID=2601811 RepID=A0A8K0PEC4_9PEZI|nr:hypothetical protein KVT40_007178 [Elsinoe batatas]
MPARNSRPKSSLESRQAVNKWCALIIPLVLIGIVGYATWVFIVQVCINYFLAPSTSDNVSPRPGAAIACITIYLVLLLPMSACYFRTVFLTHLNPGYIPQGDPNHTLRQTFVEEPRADIEWPCASTTTGADDDAEKRATKKKDVPGWYISTLDLEGIFRGDMAPPAGMEEFYQRDVFQCDPNGLPIWCGTCRNWKPDRVHHCSDVGRCVWKLDHFCPWVGGVVGETNFKFFVQFNGYAALFTAYITVVMAVVIAEQARRGRGLERVTWVVLVALSGLFLMFTGGMVGKSLQDMLMGLTTVDAIDAAKRTVFLAVKLKGDQMAPVAPVDGRRDLSIPWQGTIAYPFVAKGQTLNRPRETFAILCTPPGLNPWDQGNAANWRSVMGVTWYDWLLPVKMSPCCDHSSLESMYPLGLRFGELLEDAGIEMAAMDEDRRGRRRHKHSGRSEKHGHEHGRRHGRHHGHEHGTGKKHAGDTATSST